MTSILKVDNIQNASGTAAITINSGGVVTFANTPVNAGGGKILQVQYVNKTDQSNYSTGFGDILIKNITPSATTSVILVQATVAVRHNSVGQHTIKLIRGGNQLNYEVGDFYHPSGTGVSGNMKLQFVDAPNTTSETQYKIQVKAETGSGATNLDYSGTLNGVCSLVLMEIGA